MIFFAFQSEIARIFRLSTICVPCRKISHFVVVIQKMLPHKFHLRCVVCDTTCHVCFIAPSVESGPAASHPEQPSRFRPNSVAKDAAIRARKHTSVPLPSEFERLAGRTRRTLCGAGMGRLGSSLTPRKSSLELPKGSTQTSGLLDGTPFPHPQS